MCTPSGLVWRLFNLISYVAKKLTHLQEVSKSLKVKYCQTICLIGFTSRLCDGYAVIAILTSFRYFLTKNR